MGAYYSHDLTNFEYNVSTNNEDKKQNESHIYRNPNSLGKNVFMETDKYQTMHDFFKRSIDTQPKAKFLGTRYSDKGNLQDHFVFQTYEEIFEIAEHFGSGLSKYTKVNDKENDFQFVAFHSKNNYNYIIADLACNIYGKVILPLYDTLGAEANRHIYDKTGVEVALIESIKVKDYYEGRKNNNWYQKLKVLVILDNKINPVSELDIQQAKTYFEIVTFEQLKEDGLAKPLPWKNVKPDDVYTFSFTGGSTGFPKAAILTHRNVCSVLSTLDKRIITNGQELTTISYLPMPHIFERIMSFYNITQNGSIGVYSGDKQILMEDIKILKPTIFYSVPRIFNKIYSSVMKQVESGSFLKKSIFQKAYNSKLTNLRKNGQLAHSFYDTLAFKKLRHILGGKVAMLISGGAPINVEVMDFFKVGFSVPFLEAYGQTEGIGGEFSTFGFEFESGCVGSCFEHMEFKIVDVPEMNYLHTDKDENGNQQPRGELWIRGPNVIQGYYKNEEQTKELLEDGWMKSGDIVTLVGKNKMLKIIDRKKHIFKLSQGEYIAPEKLENIYKSANQFIANIFIHGNSNQDYIVAVINIEPGCLQKYAESLQIKGKNLKENGDFKKAILQQLEDCRVENNLNFLEKIQKIIIDEIDWQEADLVTLTFKNQRSKLQKKYKEKLEALYN